MVWLVGIFSYEKGEETGGGEGEVVKLFRSDCLLLVRILPTL